MALSPQIKHESNSLRGLSLCTGVGGLELGLHIAEPQYRTLCYVEREAFAAATLVARMEDQTLDNAPLWDDLKSFDGRPWRGNVDIISAGYPCQPFSFAGRRKGKSDPRHLWPDIARIIQEISPEWVFCENVEGHLDLGFSEVGRELQSLGFDVKAGLFSAAEVGASHLRKRLFILAHSNDFPLLQSNRSGDQRGRNQTEKRSNPIRQPVRLGNGGKDLEPHLDHEQGARHGAHESRELPLFAPLPFDFAAWSKTLERRPDLQPELFGLDAGMAHRVERAHAAGNGVCPLDAALAWRTLRDDFEA